MGLLALASVLASACGSDEDAGVRECGKDLATDAELALTPRVDTNLEQLAMLVSGRLVAGQEEYDRVVSDVSAIRDMRPDLREIGFRPTAGQGLIVRGDEDTISGMEAGEYDAWDCLNERFRAKSMMFGTDIMGVPNRVRIEFDGIYRIDLLAERYARLPGIEDAAEEYLVGDGSTICLTKGESEWHYVVDQGTGDCPAGCIDHDYSYFISTEDGAITPSGSWAERSGEPAPAWITDYVSDESCHGS
jgi:hypothetical protein